GLLDDVQFSQAWVEARGAAHPMGRQRLAWELRSKGIDGETVAEALETRDEEAELRLALQLGQQKIERIREKDPAVIRNRVAAALRKEASLEAKEEAHRIRQEAEQEYKERRGDLQRTERRLAQREETLERRAESIENRERQIVGREGEIERLHAEALQSVSQ